jgi:small GTP-binding protein
MEKKIKIKAIKIAMLGDTLVGKTSICTVLKDNKYSEEILTTIGQDKFDTKIILKNGEEIKLCIYDTAGQERFHAIAVKAIRMVHGVVVVFDVTNRQTFENVTRWLEEIENSFNKVSMVLFGNKTDVEKDKRLISEEEARKFAEEKKIPYFETSAKTQKNLKEGFSRVANDAYDMYEGSQKVIKLKKNKKVGRQKCCGGDVKIEKKKDEK